MREVELDSREYGQHLHQALFVDPLDRAYAVALGKSDGRVRIRLRIDQDAAELHAIPWERLYYYDTKGAEVPLAASGDTPFSRYHRRQLPEDGPLTERPIKMLVDVFLDPDTEQAVRWAVADALSIIDSEVVNRRVIRSILSEQAEAKFDPGQRIHLYKCLAYLIGRIRTQDGKAHRFLRETCLGEHADVRLWASAIRALGELSDPQHRSLLEQIALGEFQGVQLGEACRVNLEDGLSHAYERSLLRRRAIEALGNVGDEQTLLKLRAGKTDLDLELCSRFI